ncbi:hypothetical protein MKEN_00225800 [Mycena kentingensis (nom. inval.)]|nr:hypothetical protein MKEN_00225800 [Mycena kentingensis (nom. inval.)]
MRPPVPPFKLWLNLPREARSWICLRPRWQPAHLATTLQLLVLHLFRATPTSSGRAPSCPPPSPMPCEVPSSLDAPIHYTGSDSQRWNGRKTFDIVWGCLTTVFACTWIAVHPNVPPPNQSWCRLIWRRMKLMLITIVAPELMVGFAARQLVFAVTFSRELGVSRTHAFFICMGGFVTRHGHHPIVSRQQLSQLRYLTEIRATRVEAIADKSKGDFLSKAVALLQGVWFVTQCLARYQQNLAITELEVATLAFAAVNVFVWLLWWGKPLDVQDPIPVGPAHEEIAAAERKGDDAGTGVSDRFFGMFGATYAGFDPAAAHTHAIPSFWSVAEADDKGLRFTYLPFLVACVIGTLFGAIHCVVWTASFPTPQELWLWRVSAVFVSGTPLLLLAVMLQLRLAPMLGILISLTMQVFCALLLPLYIVSRTVLIGVPFITLRALPESAFVSVDWTVYIPHL